MEQNEHPSGWSRNARLPRQAHNAKSGERCVVGFVKTRLPRFVYNGYR
jgi:hypothetical protein